MKSGEGSRKGAAVGSGSVCAQEFALPGEALKSGADPASSWAMLYAEGFGAFFAGSIAWLNEGHIPDHHRDGQLLRA